MILWAITPLSESSVVELHVRGVRGSLEVVEVVLDHAPPRNQQIQSPVSVNKLNLRDGYGETSGQVTSSNFKGSCSASLMFHKSDQGAGKL